MGHEGIFPAEMGHILQERGCKALIYPQPIRRGSDQIWITPPMSEMIFAIYRAGDEDLFGGKAQYAAAQGYYREMYASFRALQGSDEVKVMLAHHPQQMNLSADEWQALGVLDYDLILAGHFHGGQWRLPFVGALYIPDPTAGIGGSGFLPSQQNVKGLTYVRDAPQLISAGLGAAGHRWWMDFRLFNTPEVNLITLQKQPEAR